MGDVSIAQLVFDAEKEILTIDLGSRPRYTIAALSGGSRGHSAGTKQQAALYRYSEAATSASRYANTATVGDGSKKHPYKQRGGTLPPGHYTCKYVSDHPHFHECIKLTRDADTHFRYATSSGVSLDTRRRIFHPWLRPERQ